MKKTLFYLLAALLAAAVPLTTHADPSNSPQALTFTLTCGNAVYSVTSPSQETPTALVVGSTDVSIAAVVAENISYTDSTGQNQTVQETYVMGPGHGNALGLQSSQTTCTGSPVTFPGEYGPIVVTTVITQFTTPRGR